MEIIITPNYEEMSKTAAKIIASEIRRKHDLVLGMATVRSLLQHCSSIHTLLLCWTKMQHPCLPALNTITGYAIISTWFTNWLTGSLL